MQMAYAWYPTPGRIELRYVGSRGQKEDFFMWRCTPHGTEVPSVAPISPLLGWYEREISDLFGITFRGHPEPKRLVLHNGAQPHVPPFDPSYPPDAQLPFEAEASGLPEIEDPDVQLLPFGPVRADVVESVELIFLYVGEHILHLHPQLFFKHRGMEKRFEGRSLAHATLLAERVSGVGSFAHALAFCQAVEQAAGCVVPPRARMLRSLLAELERLYNHLHYLGHLAHTTSLKVGEAEGKLLEERAKQINGKLTGSRFLRGLLVPGGLRRDLDPKPWLSAELERLREEIAVYVTMLENTNSHLDRLITTGILRHEVAFDQGATGPIQRASGFDRDLRRDHPYAAYGELPLVVPVKTAGDAHARAQVRIAEIDASIALIQRVLLLLKEGPVRVACLPPPHAEGLGWAESPRGSLFYAVHFAADGTLSRVKIKSPSFSNWRVFPFTVHDSNMMDYAINEASFGLTVAGCDR
ncbi:MAG: NADH-quinone oxidoreductase subunit C [Acetobacteraceae bacterium]|nr:NADH-quinone oxidoreductase subunit C [Methyloceanibacter sp.]MBX5472036.1 NADH-quinone oxidoreductase subunit C [Acetobacteraceae bacterium]